MPNVALGERRRGARLDYDLDTYVESMRYIAAGDAEIRSRILSTAGDRCALHDLRWSGGGDAAWESDVINLIEVDADGRIVAAIAFDVDDRSTALAEMERRFLEGEGAACADGQMPIVTFDAAFVVRDWKALRESLSDDFVSTDHRPAWMGSSTADEYVESMRTFAELSPDVVSETMRLLAWGDHGRVAMTRVTGTQEDAGPFENVFVWMLHTGEGRLRAIEVWPVDDAEAALTRFEELRSSG